MFTGLLSALGPPGDAPQGEERQDVRDEEEEVQDESQGEQASTSRGTSSGGGQPAGFYLWGLASVVTNTVRAHTEEIVKSVSATDWKAELMAFSKEAAEEGKTLKHATAELVEHLPEKLEQAEKAAASIPKQLGSAPEVQLPDTFKDFGGTLKVFGQTLLVGTKELIEQVRDGVESEIAVATRETKRAGRANKSSAATTAAAKLGTVAPGGKYSRFEAEVAAMQRDSSTYCDEPPDSSDYANWRSTHSISAVQADIDRILNENAFMAELHARIVPIIVENEDFWARYFYRLHKLQAREETRHQLAQRAKAINEEEEVGWDDDEGEEEEKTAAPADTAAAPLHTEAPEVHAEQEGSIQGVADVQKEASTPAELSTSGAVNEEDFSAPSHAQQAAPTEAPAGGQQQQQQPATTSASPVSSQGGSAEAVEHGDHDSVAAESTSDSSVKGEWVTVSTVHSAEPEAGTAAGKEAGTPRKPAEKSPVAHSPASPAGTSAIKDSSDGTAGQHSQGSGADATASSKEQAPGLSDTKTAAQSGAATGVGALVAAAGGPGEGASKPAGGSGEDEDEAWGDWD